ncbi:hypothetical protein V2J09_018797 [Rumex salicifolius]
MSSAALDPPPPPQPTAAANLSVPESLVTKLPHLRGVRWRINLCNFRSSSIDDLRRITADYRRRYAILRRRLLIDPHIRSKDGSSSANRVMDNPLSENPDSMWGRFFRNAELEKMLDQDLSRLYPEHGSYFQTPGCQSMLRRILLLWCLRHPEYGYRQGMHELLAPLLYVIHADLQHLSETRKLYEDHFTDKFDDALFQENDLAYNFDLRRTSDFVEDDTGFQEKTKKAVSLDDLDPEIQTILLLSDAYGAEGELGVVLSEKFMEHDVYCMFDALMSGVGGAVAMAEFFSHSTGDGSQNGVTPVIEASSALYHLLSIVDSSLYSHLVELGVEPQYFALRWLRVLFGREFSLENLLIIWDEIFSFDNAKLGTVGEVEPESSIGVLNSRRGAFISAMAVSMILNLRSSLLATEFATSCLQRLLNFAGSIKLDKLIGKAKSILDLALDVNVSSSCAVTGPYDKSKSSAVRGRTPLDSASTKTPLISVPESYWEEKWRDLQKEELKNDKIALKQPSTPRRGWTEKIKLRLSWSGSEPSLSPLKRDGRKEQRPVRRSLLQDLSRQLGEEFDDTEDNDSIDQNGTFHDESVVGDNESLIQNGPFHDESVVRVPNVLGKLGGIEKTFSGQSNTSEENSTIFSETGSPARGSNSLENDSEKSSVSSCVSQEMNDEPNQIDPFHSVSQDQPTLPENNNIISEDQSPTSDYSDASVSAVSDSPDLATMASKDKKSLSGKFQWLWKFGRHSSDEGTSDKGNAQVIKSTNKESQRSTMVAQPAEEQSCSGVNVKGDVAEQNLMCTLRNLGQSMLENIQVIESAFQQDIRQAGSLDNLSKSALVEKGQVRAMSAIKELRKISNLLSEM